MVNFDAVASLLIIEASIFLFDSILLKLSISLLDIYDINIMTRYPKFYFCVIF